MKKLTVKLTFTESVLGSSPSNKNIYRDFVAKNAPEEVDPEDEIEAITAAKILEKGMTIFPRDKDGQPCFFDYQIKGFFKGACSMLRKVPNTESSTIKAFKKEIDGLIFVSPRLIPIESPSEMSTCERPLRAQNAKCEVTALAMSEELCAGSTCVFQVTCFRKEAVDLVLEWLDYGVFSGLGQWHNSGKGRFTYEVLELL